MDIDNEMNAFFNFNEEEEVANDGANIQHLIDQLPISNSINLSKSIMSSIIKEYRLTKR